MTTAELSEQFRGPGLDSRLHWLNEPTRWETTSTGLQVWTDSPTDFWQRTHYGFQADSGHFLAADVDGDFLMECQVSFSPRHQYDQAGLMVRFSADCWLKCSVEYEPDGPSRLGCVVTNGGYSDWSTQDISAEVSQVSLQVRRAGPDFHAAYAPAATVSWSQMRIAHLTQAEANSRAQCGIYACSPQGPGYSARFHSLTVVPVPGSPQ